MSKGPLICRRGATHNSLQLMADFSASQSALESRVVRGIGNGGGDGVEEGVIILLACLSFSMDALESQEGLIEAFY